MSMVNFRRDKTDPKLPPRPTPPVARPSEPTPPSRPRELHPVAQEYMARYAAVWDENDALRAENERLKSEIEVARKLDEARTTMLNDLQQQLADAVRNGDKRVEAIELHFRDRLAQAERSKERYLRYAVGIGEQLKSCADHIATAHASAMEMSNTAPLDEAEKKIEAEMKDLVGRAAAQGAAPASPQRDGVMGLDESAADKT